MKRNSWGIMLLLIAMVALGFLLFTDMPATSGSKESSNPSSGRTPPDNPAFSEVNKASSVNISGVDAGSGGRQTNTEDSPAMIELQEKYAQVSENPEYPQLETRLDAMRKRHANKSFDAKEVVNALAQPSAWNRIEEVPKELPLTAVERFDGREFIRFNPVRVEAMMPGDTLEIPVWQLGERYTMLVERTQTHSNGSVSWHGHLKDFGDSHRVILTVGEGLSMGGIDTPDGHYVLQANGESGWIASSETLFKRNETETDMIIPPDEETE